MPNHSHKCVFHEVPFHLSSHRSAVPLTDSSGRKRRVFTNLQAVITLAGKASWAQSDITLCRWPSHDDLFILDTSGACGYSQDRWLRGIKTPLTPDQGGQQSPARVTLLVRPFYCAHRANPKSHEKTIGLVSQMFEEAFLSTPLSQSPSSQEALHQPRAHLRNTSAHPEQHAPPHNVLKSALSRLSSGPAGLSAASLKGTALTLRLKVKAGFSINTCLGPCNTYKYVFFREFFTLAGTAYR